MVVCINSLHAGYLLSPDFFQNKFFQKYLEITIGVSNGLDPDQDRHFVGPDLGPNVCKDH